MKITSKLTHSNKWIVNKEIAAGYDANSLIEERVVSLSDHRIKKISSRQLSTIGMMIIDTTMNDIVLEASDECEIQGNTVMLDFFLAGAASGVVDHLEDLGEYFNESQSIIYTPYYSGTFKMPPARHLNYISFVLSEEFYFKLIDKQSELHRKFAAKVLSKEHSYFKQTPFPISSMMKNVISDIRKCHLTGSLKRMFVETKVKELLILQLEQLCGVNESMLKKSRISETDLKKLKEAKAILDFNFCHPPQLAELSKIVSLNRLKLKNGFKQIYNITIYQYIIKLRMEHAVRLLKNGMNTIFEIAPLCGYTDSSNFSSAFKSYYGYSPSAFGKNYTEI